MRLPAVVTVMVIGLLIASLVLVSSQANASTLTPGLVVRAAREAPWLVVPAPGGGIILDCTPVYIYLSPSGSLKIYWVKGGLTEAEAEAIAEACIEGILSGRGAGRAAGPPEVMAASVGERGVAVHVVASRPPPLIQVGGGPRAAPATPPARTVTTSGAGAPAAPGLDAVFVALAAAAGAAAYAASRRL